MFLQAAQQGGKAGPAADGHNVDSAGGVRIGLRGPHGLGSMQKAGRAGAALLLNSYGAFRVEQLSKARIVGHIAEIRVVARLEAVAGVKTDGLRQMLQALRGAAGEALEHGAAVPDVV